MNAFVRPARKWSYSKCESEKWSVEWTYGLAKKPTF